MPRRRAVAGEQRRRKGAVAPELRDAGDANARERAREDRAHRHAHGRVRHRRGHRQAAGAVQGVPRVGDGVRLCRK